ncbi:phosphoglycolate phosphatase [Alcaligenaceae bacterium SJ-26]|nr:phosphoglycolate phosphatase [Alcaligenaceae bacterium SJ-26]
MTDSLSAIRADAQTDHADTGSGIRAVLLDLDGTLLDTIPDLAVAVNAMRTDLGLPTLPQDLIATYVGKGAEDLVQRSLDSGLEAEHQADAARQAEGLALFQTHYARVNGEQALPYPGVLDGLAALQAAGLKLAVVTNKPTAFTLPLLERTGLTHWFEVIVSGDTCPRKKPDPMPLQHACDLLGIAPGEAVMIGDSVNDALSARAAGMPVLILPYGYNEGHDVATLDADAVIPSMEAIAGWISQRSGHPK